MAGLDTLAMIFVAVASVGALCMAVASIVAGTWALAWYWPDFNTNCPQVAGFTMYYLITAWLACCQSGYHAKSTRGDPNFKVFIFALTCNFICTMSIAIPYAVIYTQQSGPCLLYLKARPVLTNAVIIEIIFAFIGGGLSFIFLVVLACLGCMQKARAGGDTDGAPRPTPATRARPAHSHASHASSSDKPPPLAPAPAPTPSITTQLTDTDTDAKKRAEDTKRAAEAKKMAEDGKTTTTAAAAAVAATPAPPGAPSQPATEQSAASAGPQAPPPPPPPPVPPPGETPAAAGAPPQVAAGQGGASAQKKTSEQSDMSREQDRSESSEGSGSKKSFQ